LFLRFLSLRDEWVRVKRTGRRTPINEKTTFATVFPKDITILWRDVYTLRARLLLCISG
jgi:hypothetical protein